MATTIQWLHHITWKDVDYGPGQSLAVSDAEADLLVRARYARLPGSKLPPINLPNGVVPAGVASDAELAQLQENVQTELAGGQGIVTQAQAALQEAQTIKQYVDDVSGIAVPADVMKAVDSDAQSDFRQQQDARALATIAATAAIPRDADITVTVGPGGEYATIRAAISALTKWVPRHKVQTPNRDGGLHAVIMLNAGYVMAEQVFVHRQNLGWITIRAVDPVVTILRSALTVGDWGGTQAAFYGRDGATMPVIACLFSMDESGATLAQSGMTLEASFATFEKGTAEKRNGIINATYRGVNAHWGSRVSAVFGDFSGAGKIGIRVANASSIGAGYVKATGCGEGGASIGNAVAVFDGGDFSDNPTLGIRVASSAAVSVSDVNFSGCDIGVYATDAATVSAQKANLQGCRIGAQAMDGARVDCHEANASGATQTGLLAMTGGAISARSAIANNCGTYGVLATDGGSVTFPYGSANGCQIGIAAVSGSRTIAGNSSATGCTLYGALADAGSFVDVTAANLGGAGANGLRARVGSTANARGATTRKGAADTTGDTLALEGSIINAHGIIGGIFGVKNTLSANGIIFQAA